MSSETTPTNLGDYEIENSLLEAIQTANALTMSEPIGNEEVSIADKVRTGVGIEPGQAATLIVAVGRVNYYNSTSFGERIWVQAVIGEQGQQTSIDIPVATTFEGTILAEDGFSDEEALALSDMAEGLKLAKKLGAITRLNSTLSFVRKPRAATTKLPVQQK